MKRSDEWVNEVYIGRGIKKKLDVLKLDRKKVDTNHPIGRFESHFYGGIHESILTRWFGSWLKSTFSPSWSKLLFNILIKSPEHDPNHPSKDYSNHPWA